MLRAVLLACLPALALAACGGSGDDDAPTATRSAVPPATTTPLPAAKVAPGGFRLAKIGSFEQPLYVTQPPDDPQRLFVVEKTGRVRVVRNGRTLRAPFLSLRGRVSSLTEQGLLGLAFAPSYRRTGLLYVAYTDRRGDLRIEERRRSKADPDRASRSRRLVLRVAKPRPTHNGGHLVFGPDGLLYIGVGDGGGPGDPLRKGQNRASLLGKVLRIDPRRTGKRRYRVPTTNPFVERRGARDEIWAYGVRNPWRFSFDRRTGAFVLGDVGQESFEEIDYRPAGDRGRGANFGWSAYEGNRRFNRRVRAPGHVPPIRTYGRDSGCSVTAGYVVRDPALPRMRGRLIYGDFCTGDVRSLIPRAPRAKGVRSEKLNVPLLSSFGQDRAGAVYAVSLEGPVYRLVPAGN